MVPFAYTLLGLGFGQCIFVVWATLIVFRGWLQSRLSSHWRFVVHP